LFAEEEVIKWCDFNAVPWLSSMPECCQVLL